MRSNQKIYLVGIAFSFLLIAPSLAFSKNTVVSKVDAPQKKISKAEPIKIAAVGTTGFGFSEAASDLKLTVDQVLEIVTDENMKKDAQSRRLALRKVIGQRFDFRQMAMHTLDNVWSRRSRKEQTQFTHLFKKLLEKSYMHMIENFQGGKVHFLSERVKGDYAFIKTHIVSSDRTIAIHYKLKRVGKEWRVYDFLVQGVSMVRNYRFQFTKVIRQESFKGLLKRLKEQTA
jgi:phospholipid transport system substrate-binding protein